MYIEPTRQTDDHASTHFFENKDIGQENAINERCDSHSMSVQKETTAEACASTLGGAVKHLFALHSKKGKPEMSGTPTRELMTIRVCRFKVNCFIILQRFLKVYAKLKLVTAASWK